MMDGASTSASGAAAAGGGRAFPPARSGCEPHRLALIWWSRLVFDPRFRGRWFCGFRSYDYELCTIYHEFRSITLNLSVKLQLAAADLGVYYRFTQQNLPSWKPAMTSGCVIAVFLIIGITFVPFGLVCLQASTRVAEIISRYDADCVPDAYRGNKQAYIKDSSIPKNCTQEVKVLDHMKAPIYVYYEMENFYQNHRRYVKSRNDKQLRSGKYTGTSCSPVEMDSEGHPIIPCGLIAWSLFNDTYGFTRGSKEIKLRRKDISWKSDREHKFGKNVYPSNFQNGSLIGGGKLNPDLPLSEQEDLIIWMRTSALPKFRKLYGVIEEDLQVEEIITILITNNYNTYSFGGKKSIVLSTSTWLGGKNDFLGYAYIVTGSLSIFMTILFALIHVKYPRTPGDLNCLSWNRKNGNS